MSELPGYKKIGSITKSSEMTGSFWDKNLAIPEHASITFGDGCLLNKNGLYKEKGSQYLFDGSITCNSATFKDDDQGRNMTVDFKGMYCKKSGLEWFVGYNGIELPGTDGWGHYRVVSPTGDWYGEIVDNSHLKMKMNDGTSNKQLFSNYKINSELLPPATLLQSIEYDFNDTNGTALLKEIPDGYEVPKTIQKGNRIYEVIVEGQKQ